jgi:hypothetical protein
MHATILLQHRPCLNRKTALMAEQGKKFPDKFPVTEEFAGDRGRRARIHRARVHPFIRQQNDHVGQGSHHSRSGSIASSCRAKVLPRGLCGLDSGDTDLSSPCTAYPSPQENKAPGTNTREIALASGVSSFCLNCRPSREGSASRCGPTQAARATPL